MPLAIHYAPAQFITHFLLSPAGPLTRIISAQGIWCIAGGTAPLPLPGDPADKGFRNSTKTPGGITRPSKPRELQKRANIALGYQPNNIALVTDRRNEATIVATARTRTSPRRPAALAIAMTRWRSSPSHTSLSRLRSHAFEDDDDGPAQGSPPPSSLDSTYIDYSRAAKEIKDFALVEQYIGPLNVFVEAWEYIPNAPTLGLQTVLRYSRIDMLTNNVPARHIKVPICRADFCLPQMQTKPTELHNITWTKLARYFIKACKVDA
ncbi:hypothetical protein DFH27DRAFT_617436 [Peziza echinospora]|nr:hypothetical protein DFH27DRAFT_617436 [Peziza echinospora]